MRTGRFRLRCMPFGTHNVRHRWCTAIDSMRKPGTICGIGHGEHSSNTRGLTPTVITCSPSARVARPGVGPDGLSSRALSPSSREVARRSARRECTGVREASRSATGTYSLGPSSTGGWPGIWGRLSDATELRENLRHYFENSQGPWSACQRCSRGGWEIESPCPAQAGVERRGWGMAQGRTRPM